MSKKVPSFQRRRLLLTGGVSLPALGLLNSCGSGSSELMGNSADENRGVVTSPSGNASSNQTIASHPPKGIHLSLLTDAHSSRGLAWTTEGASAPPQMVQWTYVDESNSLEPPFSNLATASSQPAFGVDRLMHKASLLGLENGRSIVYRVGSEAGGWSEPVRVTPIPSGDDSWRFIHFGDQGVGERGQRLAAEINKASHQHDLLLLAGDLCYADGNQPVWDVWFDQNEEHHKKTVTMAVPGNHENKDSEPAGLPLVPLKNYAFPNRFHQPGGNSFHSFTVNRVHFFGFTAGAFLEDGRLLEEMAMLEADLAMAALRRAAGQLDFIVVYQHYTVWTDQEGRAPGNGSLIAVQEQILARYGVDLVLCGHDHVYQRSHPMLYGMQVDANLGYIQVMTGTGGQSIRQFEAVISDWSAKQFIGIGFSEYDVRPGLIRCKFYGSAPTDLETREQIVESSVDQDFPLIDEFELRPKALQLAQTFVQPPRSKSELTDTYNWDWITRQVRYRNRFHRHA